MENKKRIYPSSQLVVALDSKTLKVAMWILGWSSQGSVKYYPKQFAKACKMTEQDVELCIQTLVNCKLIDVSLVDQTWMLTPNAEQFQKYYEIPMSKVLEGNGIPMAKEVTWNKQDDSSCEMSDEELQRQILVLQTMLSERKQVRNKVVSMAASNNDNYCSDLPFQPMEEWRDIEGYEGIYQVSNEGRVRNISKNPYKMMKPHCNQRGYCQVTLSKNNKYIMAAIHRLVAKAFIPNPSNLPQVNHKDEKKDNNIVENLEWCDNKYNSNYGTRGERIGEKLKGIKFSEERKIKMRGENHPFFGKHHTLESKLKISSNRKLKHHSEETKEKMKGRKRSEESIEKQILRQKKPVIQYTRNLEFVAKYQSTINAVEALGYPKNANAAICKCLKGKLLSYKGFVWRYDL